MTLRPDLTVPEQKIASLSFCDASPKAFKGWVANLPMANVGESSRQLYHAIIELNQLFVSPQVRLQLLELLRPKIRFVCGELARHYLGHAVSLPEKQRKIANLNQALQLHLANGYKLCILEFTSDNSTFEKAKKAVALCCHRAISELAATVVRAHQLYCPSPARSWLECHRIFRFASRNKIAEAAIEDDTLQHRRSSSVADSYKRLLLLGCARPNQLRQNELTQTYDLFENWTELALCTTDQGSDSLFVVNMEQDSSPIYRSLAPNTGSGDLLGFDTRKLSESIAEYLYQHLELHNRDYEPEFRLPQGISDTLLTHLSQALGILTKRSFNRIASEGSLELCVGLTAAHYYIAGEKNFTQFVAGNEQDVDDDENVFMSSSRRKNDAWSGAFDAGPNEERLYSADTPINFRSSSGSVTSNPQQDAKRPPCHKAALVNTSPGGYCVSWGANIPPSMQAGEILGVREQTSQPWSVAIVRWIRQVRNQGTQMGIELLAPSASPCGVKLIQKVGTSSEYLRGLMLPEISVINQPATLITPRLPFQTGSRIHLIHDGREDQGQLSKRVAATGSVSQFELKLQRSTTPGPSRQSRPDGTSEDEFNSLWPSL
ncbi:GTPase [Marinobacter xestospongiae]|uniref:GTPase n=1 Tax=Marinobacter xestospongiae TaxID=994319 RepID=UPI00200578DC|nr:GTPase [Marinobacter xestospongiae]MCK7568540.1 GTPase [Marinobacter xestospongiae]